MLYNHFTEDLLGLQEVKITNVEKEEENLIIKFFIDLIDAKPFISPRKCL